MDGLNEYSGPVEKVESGSGFVLTHLYNETSIRTPTC